MECGPAASDAVEKLACPEVSRVSVSITEAPSTKLSVPVGVPAPAGLLVTTAVKMTGWPRHETLVVTLNVVIVPVVWAGAMVALNEATTQAKKIERTPSFIYYRPGFASGDEGGSRVSLVQ